MVKTDKHGHTKAEYLNMIAIDKRIVARPEKYGTSTVKAAQKRIKATEKYIRKNF